MTLFKFVQPPLKGCTLKINLSEFESTTALIADCIKKTHILVDNLNLEYICAYLHENQFYCQNDIVYMKKNPEEVQHIYTLELLNI